MKPVSVKRRLRTIVFTIQTRCCGSVYLGVVVLSICEVCYVHEGMWVVQWYCILERLAETCEVVGVGLYWKLFAKMMGVVCEVVAGFLHGVVFIECW